ncbi:DEAD/DEAH box helicase [Nocardioides sp. GCM10027113]|uniref:DEAD/DEAH box helicase n=1 Tax=unclassified Nocardioides TaxID=2615069 RepID=UPI00360BEC77
MSFVPVTGPAALRPGLPPREGVVEFTDGSRSVALPVRAALPVLSRAARRDDVHASVGLLAGAALLGLRLVAAGRFEPADGGWRPVPLDDADEDRVLRLADRWAPDTGSDTDSGTGSGTGSGSGSDAVKVVRDMIAAVVDAMPRSAPRSQPAGTGVPARPGFAERLQARLATHDDRPSLVGIGLRVEADEEDLLEGRVRLVLQVHDEAQPWHVCDAARLWEEPGAGASHGFGDRARVHAVVALRAAAEAWPVLDRLLALPVPDEVVLDGDEVADLLERGVAALAARGCDVLWPRSLGRDLTSSLVLEEASATGRSRGGVREAPLVAPAAGTESLFAFRWQVSLGGDPLTEEEMAQLATAATPVLRLRGGWTVVDPSVARRARRRLVRRVSATEAVGIALSGLPPEDLVDGADGPAEVVVGASLERWRDRLRDAATREPVEPPAALQATLRDYQRHGLTWLAELTDLGLGACLADDMGLGKTVTLIALHLHRRERGHTGPTLVVCPTSLLGTWEAEIRRFAPGTPVRRHHASERDLDDLAGPGAGFVLTTYGTLRRDRDLLAAVAWDLVVADEAQHVKNSRTSTARALRALPGRARVALTGTPVENDLTELWSILDWATPGLLGSRQAFRRVWAAPIESGLVPSRAAQFRDLVSPFVLRRRKSDRDIAPELPPTTETDHALSLTREQAVLYEAFVRDTLDRISRSDELARRGLVLALLTGLKQICDHPALFLKQSGAKVEGRSQKVDLLEELVTTALAEDGAVLVFTQYVEMARLLERRLSRLGVGHQLLHGGTPVREREAMVARFQAGEVPVFLLSLRAGGTGLTLTRADHVVHVDRWWNPAVEQQATDRAHRIGQTRPVQVHRMVAVGTVEERVAELLARKRAIADAVLGSGLEHALTELDDDELRDLVRLRPEATEDP